MNGIIIKKFSVLFSFSLKLCSRVTYDSNFFGEKLILRFHFPSELCEIGKIRVFRFSIRAVFVAQLMI